MTPDELEAIKERAKNRMAPVYQTEADVDPLIAEVERAWVEIERLKGEIKEWEAVPLEHIKIEDDLNKRVRLKERELDELIKEYKKDFYD